MNAPHHPSLTLSDVIRRTVPRYTSYPTAPHFSTAVDGKAYGTWLDAAGKAGGPVSLYLHIPFCRTICHYCGCNTKASKQDEPIRAYADVLRREIRLVAERLGPVEVSHIHWGGGTPNLLPPDLMTAVVDDLAGLFRFRADMEHAIELDPRHVTREGARHLASVGVNRASLGVQDFDPAVQAAIGRIQPLEVVEQAVLSLKYAGIRRINFDLMYGLPLQTPASIRSTAMNAAGMAPDRIALFGYAHVPWFKSHQKVIDEATLPDSDARLVLSRIARETIDAFGYEEIGIDHFARPEDELTLARDDRTLHRNFQGYTTDRCDTLIGLGASSIGRTPSGFAQNAPDVGGWKRAIEAGNLPIVRGKTFEGEDLLRSEAIEELLCFFDVDLDAVAARFGVSGATFDADLKTLAPFVQAGWVGVDGRKVVIQRNATEIARVVASAFDAYLGTGGRHSVAV
ncbi:oxygen-independent coproporphyrinogen III oxidase [Chthonobacter albigriseus]|uniref:oxygen-independent coproporphyrinogen III oxidase n=1 Tax=Chthonobacter albigriseus TaxID=1683161 RepID=UPI0015EF676F|nr:oxygen-independent coproporphyrinogen III oxidase [Chthonobacter albigriseus]